MKIRVKLFAVAKELVSRDELPVEVPSSATLADVRRFVESTYPALQKILPHAMWAVDAAYASDDTIIHENSEIALIPPVSGG